MGFGGIFFHKTVYEMAAAYWVHIIRNHPFIDGNKRTGVMSAIVFLRINGYQLAEEQDINQQNKLYKLAIKTTTSQITVKTVARFLKKHSV
jgi:death-on-curing protein